MSCVVLSVLYTTKALLFNQLDNLKPIVMVGKNQLMNALVDLATSPAIETDPGSIVNPFLHFQKVCSS